MAWPVVGAIIGAGASLLGASQNAKAAKDAGQVQQQATQQQIQLLNQQRADAFRILGKYGVQGDWANNQIAALLGAPQMPARTAAGPGGGSALMQSGPDYAGYVRNSPDLMAEFSKPGVASMFGNDIGQYGQWHANTFGDREVPQFAQPGVQTPAQPGDDDYKTPDQRQEEAWETYESTPFAKIGETASKNAQEAFMSMSGAQGSALSGRTVRGLAEVENEAKQGAFGSYLGYVGGMADQGFQADAGMVSAGQNFATQAGGAMTNAANASANAKLGQANAWNSALSDAAGWAGWAAGNMYNPSGNVNASRVVQSPGAIPNSPTPQTSTQRSPTSVLIH